MNELQQHAVPVKLACDAFDLARSSYYHGLQPTVDGSELGTTRPTPERALSGKDRQLVYDLLVSDRFVDQAPRQVYATLLDEGIYHCSISTMYRILNEHAAVFERRNQRQHPPRVKPQLLADAPNQLWSWDITKLRSETKYSFFYLYVILDVFSRYVVGWMIAEQESAELAQQLMTHSCQQEQIAPAQLTLHADRGGPMVALTTAQLLESLGVQKTHSRPYTPNDNAYSEAQFKTLKYRPDFPGKFATAEAARTWARGFFDWYNTAHHHSGLALLTPETVHRGQDQAVIQQRTAVLHAAYAQHPERFVKGKPQHPRLSSTVWINPPPKDGEKPPLLQ